MRFILILITTFLINSGCDTYSEHSIYLREMEENDSLIILKQVHYGKGFITTNINDEVYLNNETFVKIDTVETGKTLMVEISTKDEILFNIKTISDSLYETDWLKINVTNKKYSGSFVVD